MSPDHVARLGAMYDEMSARCEMVWMLNRVDPDADDSSGAVGAMILADDGGLLVLEATIDVDGHASVTAQFFDCDMQPAAPSFTEIGNTIMITS